MTAPIVCDHCNDTHKMQLRDQTVACTRCPLPCELCRDGAFCSKTPCDCRCHRKPQPFRAGDAVEVLAGPCKGQTWVVAVYEAERDLAWIAGWPCTMVTHATAALKLHRAATDKQHAEMIEGVGRMRGDHGEGDPRRSALERVTAAGGTP